MGLVFGLWARAFAELLGKKEGRCRAGGGNRRGNRRTPFRFDFEIRDVDDARETAQSVEEIGEVVVAAIEVQRDGKLGIEFLRPCSLGSKAKHVEARFGRELLYFAQEVVDFLPARKDARERLESRFFALHLTTKLGKPVRRRLGVLDFRLEGSSLVRLFRDLLLHRAVKPEEEHSIEDGAQEGEHEKLSSET